MSFSLPIQFHKQVASTFPLMFLFWYALPLSYALLHLFGRVIFHGGVESQLGPDFCMFGSQSLGVLAL